MPLQIVVPMAGEGRRFQECGFAMPKPLIPVGGMPMVVRAVQDLPAAKRVIFLARTEHLEKFPLLDELRRHVPGCEVVAVGELTAGQACTVRLAAERLEKDWPVVVAACDNTHLYDHNRLSAAMADPAVECLIWTYRNDARVLANPAHHGWVEVDGRRVVRVSCKVPISANPLGDHAITGCFSFKNAGRMIQYIDRMVAQDVRVRGEFYLDTLPNLLVADGLRAEVFEVEKYIGWGTPADLHDFEAWEATLPNSANSEIPQGETARHIRRFLVVGVLSVLIDLTTYALLLKTGLYVPVAKGISYATGMVFGFFGNKFWTFQSARKSVAEPVVYLVLYAITMGVNVAINSYLLDRLSGSLGEHFAKSIAFLFATGVTTVLNFLGMRMLAFRAGIRDHRELLQVENEKAS